jgi:uncharacterized membrane protein YvbJ
MAKSKYNGKYWFCQRCRKQNNGKTVCNNCGNPVKSGQR